MKKTGLSFGKGLSFVKGLFFVIVASLLLLINASVWEGTAGVSQALPETGLYVATNSFPINTVVYITNLENGKTVRLVVSSGLESSGLLALLSRDAADSIGLQQGTMGRIRMGQFTDEMAYSGYGADGISLYNPDAMVDLDEYGFPNDETGWSQRIDDSGLFVDLPDVGDILAVPAYTYPDPVLAQGSEEILQNNPELNPADFISPILEPVSEPEPPLIALQTPENNTPRTTYIDPSLFIEPIREAPVPSQVDEPAKNGQAPLVAVEPVRSDPVIDPVFVDPVPTRIEEPVKSEPMPAPVSEPVKSESAPAEPSTGFTIARLPGFVPYEQVPYGSVPSGSVPSGTPDKGEGSSFQGTAFSAPLIGYLEKGSYYVQIGAYSKPETVESEIQKIDRQLPVAIMNAGSEEKPVYRILIGPLNLGESGAILQRYKGIYKDAFVRQGI